jgi:translocation and assembly module TamB
VRIAVNGRGTLDAPILTGTIAGDGLRVDAPPYGIALRDGRVRAHLADGGLAIDEISIMGGEGRFTASGTVAARREGADAPRTRIAWRAENFRATNRPELRLVVDGSGTLAVVDKRLDLSGNVKIVDGRIEYERTPPGQLGTDVVVVGRPRKPDRDDSIADLPLRLDVDVDLGNRLSFSGAGLETALNGRVHVTTSGTGQLMGQGSIAASNGTYFAFGQKLTIERGRLIFDGPLDNPALDVVALRKNLAVEAGVELTGTAKVPRVRVTSNPPVPENEALAWLITGEGLQAGSRSDYAALSAASSALLSNGGKPLTQQIAQTIGLDDITVRGGGLGGTNPASGTAGQVIVFGKRITDKLTLGYEQGLSIATNALRIEYALSNTLTLRAEAGTISGLGIFYRRSFE